MLIKTMSLLMLILLSVQSNAGNLLNCSQNYKSKSVQISDRLKVFLSQENKEEEIFVILTFFKGESVILIADTLPVKGVETNIMEVFQKEVNVNGRSETPEYPISDARQTSEDVKKIIGDLGGESILSKYNSHSHKMEIWVKAPIKVISDFLEVKIKDLVFADKARQPSLEIGWSDIRFP